MKDLDSALVALGVLCVPVIVFYLIFYFKGVLV